MGDDSSRSIVKSLRNELSLFLEVFQGSAEDEKEPSGVLDNNMEFLDLDQIRETTKALLHDRAKLNQKLESLSKELDLNTAKLESQKLVGANQEETLQRISDLHDLGQSISQALEVADKNLRAMREREKEVHQELLAEF